MNTYKKQKEKILSSFSHNRFLIDIALSVGTKIVEVALTLAAMVLLGRLLGAEGFGIYAFALAIASLVSIPTRIGLPQLVVRETAAGFSRGRWRHVAGIWRWSTIATLFLSLILAAVAILFICVTGYQQSSLGTTLLIAVLLVPLLSLSSLRSAILRGLREVGAANLTGLLVQPATLAVLLIGSIAFPFYESTPALAMSLMVISSFCAFVFGTWILRSKIPLDFKRAKPQYKVRSWLSAAWPMAITQGAYQISRYIDVIILGVIATMIDAGIYRVAAQGAFLVSLGLVTMGLVTAPRFARLHALGHTKELQRLVRRSSQIALLLSFLVTVALAIAGQAVLIYFFGEEFQNAWLPLMILSTGHVISTAIGPTGLILNMTGHERHVTRAVVIAAFLNIILNFSLIPIYGAVGASIATSTSLVFWKTWLWFTTQKKLGVRCSFL